MNVPQGQLYEIAAFGGLIARKKVTLDGSAGNGAIGTFPVFTVKGQVLIALICTSEVVPAGASGTLKVGNATTTTRYLPSLTATTLVAGATEDLTGLVTAGTALKTVPCQMAQDGEAIIATVATTNLTAGTLDYYAFYWPLTDGASVS